jgi:hypothetical protein
MPPRQSSVMYAPMAASKAQVGVLYCRSSPSLKAYNDWEIFR